MSGAVIFAVLKRGVNDTNVRLKLIVGRVIWEGFKGPRAPKGPKGPKKKEEIGGEQWIFRVTSRGLTRARGAWVNSGILANDGECR
jgi:hypothetical protein